MSDVVEIACDGCGSKVSTAYCSDCVAEDAKELETPTNGEAAADQVRDWLDVERIKPGMSISPEVVAAFERCISDLEAR